MRTRSELADAVAAEEERLRNEHREAGERRESLHRAAVRQARVAAEAESSANSAIIADALAVRNDKDSQPMTVDDHMAYYAHNAYIRSRVFNLT